MNRYFYYITIINMIASMVASMPKILLLNKEEGAIISILLSIPIGLVFCFLVARFFQYFPGQDLPQLMGEYLPKLINIVFLALVALVWFAAGLLSVIAYSFSIKRFLSPNADLIFILSLILIFIYYGALMKTKSVLYTIEVIFIITFPLILLLLGKGITNPDFEIDFVKVAVMHIQHAPNYSTVCAAAFIFWGPANLIVFNKVMTNKQSLSWKGLFLIGIVGTCILCTSFFVPIGMLGFEAVDAVVNPGITTADTLHINYWIIERVIFIALMLFLAITFISILIHWHVALELLKKVVYFKKFEWKNRNLTPHLILIVFWLVSSKTVTYLNEYQLVKFTSYFYNILPVLFLFMFLIFAVIRRRAQV